MNIAAELANFRKQAVIQCQPRACCLSPGSMPAAVRHRHLAGTASRQQLMYPCRRQQKAAKGSQPASFHVSLSQHAQPKHSAAQIALQPHKRQSPASWVPCPPPEGGRPTQTQCSKASRAAARKAVISRLQHIPPKGLRWSVRHSAGW